MAVYTALEFGEIETLVAPLALGRLIAARGVAAGVENTTYFLEFGHDRSHQIVSEYVLTIAETLSRSDLEFIATLMHDLSARGLPVPAPVIAGDIFAGGTTVLSVRGKPALLVAKIAGAHPQSISANLCQRIGTVLAELHTATLELGYRHESHRSLTWVAATGKAVLPHVDEADRLLLNQELKGLSEFVSANTGLPQAIIHGDLFRDNVLVNDGSITGIIDFFSAGTGYLLLDLAIVVNDWCFDACGNLNFLNYNKLTKYYCTARKPETEEIKSWSELLRIAALRFWVSRLNEQLIAGPHAPRGRGKDPLPYRQLLLLHRDLSLRLPS